MQKEKFEKIAKVIVENSTSVEDIKIDEFVTNGFKHVFLVVKFSGGAISVRNVNGNGLLANLEELAKLLRGGYYSEVETYKDLKEKSEVEKKEIFKCPNCGSEMDLYSYILFDSETYDKWVCSQCPLIVLDWRGEDEL